MTFLATTDVPTGTTSASKASISSMVRAGRGIKPVADATARAQAVTDWPTATGAAISAANPVMVWREDVERFEVSVDGTNWSSLQASEDAGWVGLTLTNSWTQVDATNTPAQYCKVNGFVYLRGLVKPGTVTIETPIATLPAGFRPGKNTHWASASWQTGTYGQWVWGVNNNGTLVTKSGALSGWCSLDGAMFRAEA